MLKVNIFFLTNIEREVDLCLKIPEQDDRRKTLMREKKESKRKKTH